MTHLNSFHVVAGSLYVGNSQPTEAYALLGTCVGVTLHAPEAAMSGMIHLLLPDPTQPAGKYQPERYAATGLPILLNHFLKAGIQPDRLKACIAGGAIIGPVHKIDLHLDIGGRTVEAVNAFLKNAGIRVEKSETGGYITRRLTLNMQNGNCCIEPAFLQTDATQETAGVISRDQIIGSMEKLRPIPQIALKILRRLGENTCDLRTVAPEVQKDQVLTAKILKLCNSPLFFHKEPVESIVQALILLGWNEFSKIVISVCVQDQFLLASQGYSLCKGGLYYHAVAVAVISEALARRTGQADPMTAYVAGLIHDIGKVVLDQCVASIQPVFYRTLHQTGQLAEKVEKELFGIDHCEAGGWLAESWMLPETLQEAIRCHHTPELVCHQDKLVNIVHMADLLAGGFDPTLKTQPPNTQNLRRHLEKIGCDAEKFAELVDLMPFEFLTFVR
jgi:putative nucleotidyltransferase with HDIG domain